MNNREIYSKDPSNIKLVNEGVANVNDDMNTRALAVLRYELETFVCDGQYEKGLEHILEIYLKNIDQAQQPGVWISGFFGSGKSHLVKMLRALWIDTEFEDGATARGIVNLPQAIRDLLQELNTRGKRYGGLHAASGTLGSGVSDSVRLALLGIVFKSVGLPEKYPIARFVMWLKSEGIYNEVRNYVEKQGYQWKEELDNLYVAEGLHKALVALKANTFSSEAVCVDTLNNLFPHVPDVSNDEMVKAIQQALSVDGKFPLTLIVLDEVQQYIGENSQRSIDVQEVVEACCKSIGGKLLFIGTGQTAVTGTANLKRLEGRFTVRIELSDNDVDTVVRKVILAKKPGAIENIDRVLQENVGEITRQLAGAAIGHRQDDTQYFVYDYPILPVRRRFWESSLRTLDYTGADSQLRNQLSLAHKVIQTNLDKPVGNVVAADYLYFDLADRLLQARILPRTVYEKTMHWINGSTDEKLMARACGIIFLINKLTSNNKEVGIKSDIDTIADLMVTDLYEGSSLLRGKLPSLLDKCEVLMKVDNEYRIHTEESSAWNDEFLSQCSQLSNEVHRLEAERDDRIRKKFPKYVKKLSFNQGISKVTREINIVFDSQLPDDSASKIYVWVRNGWSTDENSVLADARQAGNQSPTIFLFLPKRSADDLRHYLIDYKAASATLDKRGVPATPEGIEARSAIETIKQTAEGKINELLEEVYSGARLFQASGNEIIKGSLQEMIFEAAENALTRLYPQFHVADNIGWEKVYSLAQKGAPDALKAIDPEEDPVKNPVCKSILGFVASGKKGVEIRNNFEESPFGWSRDAIDGSIQVLLLAGLIRAHNERGEVIEPKFLERRAIGKTIFKVEAATVSTPQRIQVRKVIQKVGCKVKKLGDELNVIPEFLEVMKELAEASGGEAPKPKVPDTSILEEIRRAVGNEKILIIYNKREELLKQIEKWKEASDRITERMSPWESLKMLLQRSGNIELASEIRKQADSIEEQRLLLAEPDLIQPLLKQLEDVVRKELVFHKKRYVDELEKLEKQLESNPMWGNIPANKREILYKQSGIEELPDIKVGTLDGLLSSLSKYPISTWVDRIDALSIRFNRLQELIAKEFEPRVQTISLPRRTLQSEEDIQAWIKDIEKQLTNAINKGPIVVQ
ncbi:BREX system P-loop protein BrxC [Priestia megaterium]|uniref:BREX system P-loop protein BrxC n=1 Tax=Priestia megaterium TaxID=1404 RepID=UPI0028776193|nr:BREX system P-loop protein BrxC [Priestia megaterium]